MPRVSIVLLSWNQADYVAACLRSIASQTFHDFEIVAVDNGSSDDSADLIEREAAFLDVPISLVRNSTNRGIPAALNQAIGRTTGDFIVPFAADDVMLPHRLESQVHHLDSCDQSYAAICGDVALIDSEGRPLARHPNVRPDPNDELTLTDVLRTPWLADEALQLRHIIAGSVPLAPSAMFRSSTYEQIGPYDESIAIEDYDYWLRIAQRSKISYQPGVVALYRRHRTNATSQKTLIYDAVYTSLTRLDPTTLSMADRTALARRLTDVRYRSVYHAISEKMPDCRERLGRIVRDRDEPTSRRVKSAISWCSPSLAQRVITRRHKDAVTS